ncbi:MAG: hypothetical protein ACPHUL_00070 [Marinomonas gallaica]
MPALPAEFEINKARITNNDSVTSSESQSKIFLQRKTPGQRWDINLKSVKMDLDAADAVWGFAAARTQDLLLWDVVLPRYSYSEGTVDKTVNDDFVIGQTSVSFNSTAADVRVGKYFQFAGHSKVYIATSKNGNSITFAPALVRPVADDEAVTFNDITWSCKLRGRPLEFNVSGDEQSVVMELDLVEAL